MFLESAIILAIVVLGGMGSQLGVVLAAVAVTILPELAREFSDYRMLVFAPHGTDDGLAATGGADAHAPHSH